MAQLPLQYALLPLPLTAGVDTRTEPKAILPPKLTTCDNGRFTTPGTISKRHGYAPLAELAMYDASTGAFFDRAITGARKLLTRAGNLFLTDANTVYGLSPTRSRWQRFAQVPNVQVTQGNRFWSTDFIIAGERGTAPNGATLVVLHTETSALVESLVVILYDPSGTEIYRTNIADATVPRLVVVGSMFSLFYVKASTHGTLSMIAIDSAAAMAPNAITVTPVTIASDLNTTNPRYDADVSGGRILVAYNTSTASTLKFGYVEANGNLDGTMTTQATAAAPTALSCAVEPTARTILVCWAMASGSNVAGRMYDESKTALFAVAALGVTSGGATASVTCIFRDATNAEVFLDFTASVAVGYNSMVSRATVTTGGTVVLTAGWMRHSVLSSKPWVMGGKVHLALGYPMKGAAFTDPPQLQSTLFIVTSGMDVDPGVTAAAYPSETYSAVLTNNHCHRADVIGTTVRLTPTLWGNTINPFLQGGTLALGNLILDYSYAPQFIEAGNATYYTGGALWMLDGAKVVETGFWIFPENVTAVPSATGGMVPSSSYSYHVFAEWYSAAGERFLSTTAAAVVVALGPGDGRVTLTIPTLVHTRKTSVLFHIYRTQSNGALFNSVGTVVNDTTVNSVTFVDNNGDGTIVGQELDYLTGSQLDNVAPPPCSVICSGSNRVFISVFEDPNLVLASKLQDFGQSLSFNDSLTLAVPPGPGPITALAYLNDSLVVFRDRNIYVVTGPGPNNIGSGGQFDPARTLSDDIGCISPRSLVRIPQGFLFQSRKGIYLLDTTGTLSYVGADVEAYNAETVTSAVALVDAHEVRFTLASGKSLLFDYIQNAWSPWTIGGVDSIIWNDLHVILPTSSGLLLQETPNGYLDNGVWFSLVIETPEIHVAGTQGIQRVRRVLFLGKSKSDHKPLISIAYNHEPFYEDRQTWDPGTVIGAQLLGGNGGLLGSGGTFGGNDSAGRPSTSVYQFRCFPARPKCQAIKVRIEDVPRPGFPMGESYNLSEIAFEVGIKTGSWSPGADKVTS